MPNSTGVTFDTIVGAQSDSSVSANTLWYGEVDRRHKGGERFRRRFETKAKAEGYEAYVKATGEEPRGLAEGDITGRTFASVAAECKEA